VSNIQNFGFSPSGHGLLTLLVSFLVISKVNHAYDRYKAVRYHIGKGTMVLRELIQIAITISSTKSKNNDGYVNNDPDNDREKELRYWRSECVAKVIDIIDTTTRVLQDRSLAKHLARNKPLETTAEYNMEKNDNGNELSDEKIIILDPLIHIQSLRLHLYCTSDLDFELLERVSLVNKLQEYASSYTNLLIFASTPLPFPLVQMGRAFLFIWTFSMPLVLLEGPFSDFWSAQVFLFFLTYGFIGLELVSIKLSDPFGDGRDDVQIKDIRNAMMDGIENDLKQIPNQTTISERRLLFSKQKRKIQQQQQSHPPHEQEKFQDHSDQDYAYHAMTGSNAHHA